MLPEGAANAYADSAATIAAEFPEHDTAPGDRLIAGAILYQAHMIEHCTERLLSAINQLREELPR